MLKFVRKYMDAGNSLPDLSNSQGKPQSIDPAVIEMGGRQDHLIGRQRARRNPGDDSFD